MDWLLFSIIILIIIAVLIDLYLMRQSRYKLNHDIVLNSSIADLTNINQASQAKEVYQYTNAQAEQTVNQNVENISSQPLQCASKKKNTIAKKSTRKSDINADELDADEILGRIFTIARPDTNNCLEVLMMLEQLAGKVTPEHLKKLKLLFNVYGSNNHLFDEGLVKVVTTCCSCRAKFELLEHIFTESEFYPYVDRSLELDSSATKTGSQVQ